ncbi:epsin-3-like [Humulus lupulus]|uniref:epsin-3-like n=1 Tax=Humulus lupulus TaxID=3486 RepID=UPI002B4157A6|nr:epsin-3-like [Humulus lupulus]
MGNPFFHELKRQASLMLKEKVVKPARLALTDVTPVQLMTEDVTNGNLWPPDTRTLKLISRAAFEVDDYWRIVEILHRRLLNFDRENWRGPYKAMILLEYLLTHGPLRIFEEFQEDKDIIKQMGSFQCVDEKGFNWGLRVNKLSEKVLNLLENSSYFKEERGRARKLTIGIKGLGSFNPRSSSIDASLKEFSPKSYDRCNSDYIDHHNEESLFFYVEDGIRETQSRTEENPTWEHSFFGNQHYLTKKPVVILSYNTELSNAQTLQYNN